MLFVVDFGFEQDLVPRPKSFVPNIGNLISPFTPRFALSVNKKCDYSNKVATIRTFDFTPVCLTEASQHVMNNTGRFHLIQLKTSRSRLFSFMGVLTQAGCQHKIII